MFRNRSYRHMVKTLRQINPDIRIIIPNYHYSQFDIYTCAAYGKFNNTIYADWSDNLYRD